MKNKCLNCIFKVINFFLTIVMPFFSAWIGVKVFYFYNVFEKIISDDDLARDVGITVYIAIAEILLNKGLNLHSIASINDSGSLVINVEKLFSEQKYINTRLDFVILFIKNEAGESKSDLETEIVNDSVFTDFISNKAVIEIR
ncbi:hypothetical protein [Ruminococcus sp.]|uniref:hypothetical protein n=1 Tax=Ruminococcus sp. TaxID=41978 RepID=UPI0025F51099|nr:hypothetical protein [Ruminococcus sp.]